LPEVWKRGKESKFSEIFLQNTSIFARRPKKGKEIFKSSLCRTKDVKVKLFYVLSRTHQIFARKPKKRKSDQIFPKFSQNFLVQHILSC